LVDPPSPSSLVCCLPLSLSLFLSHQQLPHPTLIPRRQHQHLSSPTSAPSKVSYYHRQSQADAPLLPYPHFHSSTCVGLSASRYCRCWRHRHPPSARRQSTKELLLCSPPQIPLKSPTLTLSSSRNTFPKLLPRIITAGCKTSTSTARLSEASFESDRNSLLPPISLRASSIPTISLAASWVTPAILMIPSLRRSEDILM
jgi:hypothetical protein